MATQDLYKLMKEILDHWAAGNVLLRADHKSKYLADNVRWQIVGALADPLVGVYNGPDEVEEMFALHDYLLKDMTWRYDVCMAQDNKVVVIGYEEATYKLTQRVLKGPGAYYFTFNDEQKIDNVLIFRADFE